MFLNYHFRPLTLCDKGAILSESYGSLLGPIGPKYPRNYVVEEFPVNINEEIVLCSFEDSIGVRAHFLCGGGGGGLC